MKSEEILPSVSKSLGVTVEEFQNRIDEFFDPYFDSFGRSVGLLDDFKSKSGGFFALKKGCQLSHARSIWENRIKSEVDPKNDVTSYFLGRLFIDYYETFPLHLFPILSFYENKGDNESIGWPNKGDARRDLLIRCLKNPQLIILRDFYTLRNKLSHAGVLFEKDHFCSWEVGNAPKKKRLKEEFQHFELMMNIFISYATELDLRILGLAKRENEHLFNLWIEYFDIYVTWFHKNLGRPKPQA